MRREFNKYNVVLVEEPYVNGILHGTKRIYRGNETLKVQSEMKFGKRDGNHLEFFKDGRLRYFTQTSKGRFHGHDREWNKDGSFMYWLHYENGDLHGRVTEMMNNGYLIDGYYKRNKKWGVFRKWNHKYELVSKKIYKDGNMLMKYEKPLESEPIPEFCLTDIADFPQVYVNGI